MPKQPLPGGLPWSMGTNLNVSALAAHRPRIPFRGCPLCDSRDFEKLKTVNCTRHGLYHPLVPPNMQWMRCMACDHVFTDGYFSDDVLAAIFSKTNSQQIVGAEFERMRYLSAHMIEKVARYRPAGRWLDVGFGNGSLLMTAAEWGFDPVGIDLRQQSVDALKAKGIEAYCRPIENFTKGSDFSVISMADVLEHTPFPKIPLQAAHRLTADGGILLVSMPNYDCPAWRELNDAENPYWVEIEHYHNFSRPRLYSLLAECGFEPIHYDISERYRVCMEVLARKVVR